MSVGGYGSICALAAALGWSVAVVLFKHSGVVLDPLGLNLFKSVIALVLLVATLLVWGNNGPELPAGDVAILLTSGAVGIGLADSLFFISLNILGASRQAIVDCSYSPFIVLFSVVILGERLSGLDAVGALLIVTAVLIVGLERRAVVPSGSRQALGVACGLGAMAAMGLAIVAVKPLLEKYDLVTTAVVRLSGGVGVLLLLLLHPSGRRRVLPVFRPQRIWRHAIGATVIGNYAAMLFWVAGFKYTTASVASILNQTSTVFIVLLAAVFLGEPLTRHRILALVLGSVGSVLVLV